MLFRIVGVPPFLCLRSFYTNVFLLIRQSTVTRVCLVCDVSSLTHAFCHDL